jgi:hypothetical protein
MAMSGADFGKFMRGAGYGGIGAGIGSFFGSGNNPADAAGKYINQIPGAISPYYDPYINAGKGAIPILEGQYGNLLNDPGGMINKIGAGYQQSPGFKFALQQALKGANQSAAAGGMAGSPAAQQQSMGIATNLANQDYYNWLQQAEGMYGRGLSGEEGLMHTGFEGAKSMADQIAQAMAQRAAYEYQGQAGQNEGMGAGIGDLFGGLGLLGAFGGI